MVEMEESAQAVAPLHVGGRAPRQWRLLQKPVVESLMVSLAVVVLDVLPREKAQVVLTERDHTIETFLFDRPHEPFGVRVEIGTPRRQPNGLDPAAHQDVVNDTGVQRIPVVNEIARSPQETVNGISERAGHLLHPRAAGLLVDAGDMYAARLQLDHEEDQVPLETGQREHFDGKEVGSGEAAQCASKNVFQGVR